MMFLNQESDLFSNGEISMKQEKMKTESISDQFTLRHFCPQIDDYGPVGLLISA